MKTPYWMREMARGAAIASLLIINIMYAIPDLIDATDFWLEPVIDFLAVAWWTVWTIVLVFSPYNDSRD